MFLLIAQVFEPALYGIYSISFNPFCSPKKISSKIISLILQMSKPRCKVEELIQSHILK